MTMEPEFVIDEEPKTGGGDFRRSILEFIRKEGELRRALQELRLGQQADVRKEEDFLRKLIAAKEKRCEQFIVVERQRQAEAGSANDGAAREETEKWLGRLERLQQDFDAVLEKHGVTRYEPAGKALPERDDIKDVERIAGVERGTIVRTLKPGYLWRGQLLRSAEVVVAD